MARTGFHSRFLLGQRGMGTGGRLLLTLFVLGFGGCVAFGGVVVAVKGLREALDPGAAMYRLRTPTPDSQRSGAFRRSVRVVAGGDALPPICEVVHEHYVSGKNGGWRRDASWSRSVGASLARPGEPDVQDLAALSGTPIPRINPYEAVRFDPFDPLVVPSGDEEMFRSVLRDVPPGGRLRAHCAAPGQTVFVDGCFMPDGRGVTGCNGEPLTVTTGDGTAQPRIDAHASSVAGRLGGGALALVAALAYLWYVLRTRPLADALIRRAGPVPVFAAWPQIGMVVGCALVVAFAQGGMVWTADAGSAASRGRPGYLIGLLAFTAAAVLALVVRHRRKNLDRALAPVLEAQTVPLRDARGGVVELAVSVRDGAEPARGVLDGAAHAWVDLRVDETCQQGKSQVTNAYRRRCWPECVPVVDDSGEGWLDLTHAELDLRSTVRFFKEGSNATLSAAIAASPVGALRSSSAHVHWVVEQSVLDPGERLYVLGQCRRVENPKGAGSYRADSTMPVVGGSADARIIVHAGTERSLLRSIGLERTYLDLLTAGLAGVALSAAAVMIALASL